MELYAIDKREIGRKLKIIKIYRSNRKQITNFALNSWNAINFGVTKCDLIEACVANMISRQKLGANNVHIKQTHTLKHFTEQCERLAA